MAELTFNTSNPLISRIDRMWDYRDSSGSGYVWGAMSNPRGIEFRDINGDGLKDLIIVTGYFNHRAETPLTGTPIIYSLNENGKFQNFQTLIPSIENAFSANDIFQFTWKQASYILIIDQGLEIIGPTGFFEFSKNWLYRFNTETETLVDVSELLPDNDLAFNHTAHMGDINKDGYLDLFFSRLGPGLQGGVWWSFEDTIVNRSSELPSKVAETTTWSDGIGTIHYGDFDDNGVNDIVSLGYDQTFSTVSTKIYFNFSETPITINPPEFVQNKYYPGTDNTRPMGAADCVVGDIDNDGDQDIIIMWEGSGASYLQVLSNEGNKQFNDVTASWFSSTPYRDGRILDEDGHYPALISRIPSLRDVDGDGFNDLILKVHSVAGEGFLDPSNNQQNFIYKNDGHSFTPYDFSSLSTNFKHLYSTTELRSWNSGVPFLTDITGDGVSDLTFIKGAESFTIHNGEYYSDFYQIITFQGESSIIDDPVLSGNESNNRFNDPSSNDVINGGSGIDTVYFTGTKNTYSIAKTDSSITISGANDNNQLFGIERIQFNDLVVAFDTAGNAGEAYRIYKAAFDRAPDQGGLGYWIHAKDNGTSLSQIADSFLASQEFKGMYGTNPTNEAFVTLLYNNVLDRTPDAGGMSYWLNNLNTGALTKAGVLASFSESVENQNNVATLIGNGIEYTPWA